MLSITDGGPGARVLGRVRFGRPDVGSLLTHAALLLGALTWVPLFALSLVEGLAFGGAQLPFLYDIASHVRFLFAVPALVLADLAVGNRLRNAVHHLLVAGLIRASDRERFDEIIGSTTRFRDSRVAEVVVIGVAYAATYPSLRAGPAHGLTSWLHAGPDGGLSLAGYWNVLIALPIFWFLICRWAFRMLVWARFLSQVARLDLQLTPTHPDGAGGLGVIGKSAVAYGPVLFTLSAVMASAIATRILFAGDTLEPYRPAYIALIVVALTIFIGPLLALTPTLIRCKRQGLLQYGALATQYIQRFHRKWVEGSAPPDDAILGSPDIQSLGDLAASYELVRKMRIVPVELGDFVQIALAGILPGFPLLATVMPVGEILESILHLLG